MQHRDYSVDGLIFTPHSALRTPNSKRAFSLVEAVVLIASVMLVSQIGASVHRSLWQASELQRYRATMHELSDTLRTMPWRAGDRRRTLELRADSSRGSFQLIALVGTPHRVEVLERTIWLPEGLEINDAPPRLTTDRSGRLPPASIIVGAPSYHRQFRVTTSASGSVQLHEEPSL